jgi:DNA modification methylase
MVKQDINYALVEEIRPEVYAAMKYWGKKPHNVWRTYIENYTPENGVFLDPFAGSAISAFEAVKVGRKAIAFDLNPMTAFFIEVFTSKYDPELFKRESDSIIDAISKDGEYLQEYTTTCQECGDEHARIVAYKWDSGNIYEVAIQCNNHGGRNGFRYTRKPTDHEIKLAKKMSGINITKWTPDDDFRDTNSFSASFIKQIGGKKFINLWTKRNLYILSEIFDQIMKVGNAEVKKQLMYSFVQTVHLTTKMSVPRRPSANRDFSTSWGRSAYIAAARQMEMNPLHIFIGSCFGKQSTDSSLRNIKEYIGKSDIKTLYVDRSNKSNRSNNFDIKYGIIDALTLADYIDEKSVDFVMTDPPYGGLVQYLDLSTIWLIWLKHFDAKYTPNYDSEITVNNKNGIEIYHSKFTKALKNINKVLKDDGKVVFTFHNNKIDIWNSFLNSIMMSGFKIEKVIHQQNRRTGESNVANPYGTSGTDFYIRCVKSATATVNTDRGDFEHFMLTTAIRLIAERNEPTPYQILFNGLLAELSNAGFNVEDFDENIESFLKKRLSDVFNITSNDATKAGDYWWFRKPSKYIKQPDKPLTNRVEDSIVNLLRRKLTVTYDEVLAEIFIQYPNGLTPNVASIVEILKKYATKSTSDKWAYKGGEVEKEFTKHTEVIKQLVDIGKKMGFKSYVGRREQPEPYRDRKLGDFSDYKAVSEIGLDFNQSTLDRIGMIDLLWVKNGEIKVALEVENSTNFTSGIQRASNLSHCIPKLMIVPNYRENEINSIKDPLFVESFKSNGWRYLTYSDVDKSLHLRDINLMYILNLAQGLK